MQKIERRQRRESRCRSRRLAAALVVLAIGFMLLAPDPHDHGDAGSIGGLFRLLLPNSSHAADPHQSRDKSQPEADESCPVHFWYQVAATGLLFVLLLRFFLSSLFSTPSFVTFHAITHLESFHSRAPPAFS